MPFVRRTGGKPTRPRSAACARPPDRLPDGVVLRALTVHPDSRGALCEIFRASWPDAGAMVQWNAVHSRPGVLRGFHVHPRHDDCLTIVAGRLFLGLRDLRAGSPTQGLCAALWLEADHPALVTIPRGVGHGFAFVEPSVHVYALDRYWDPADELGCRWDDPALGIAWPVAAPLLSERDAKAGSLAEMTAQLQRALADA